MAGQVRAERRSRAGERGQILVLFLLSITALFAAAGLAFDVGRFYVERRFLQNAADAAALAAANTLISGHTEAEARAEAIAVLQKNYNMPPNGVTPATVPNSGLEVYESGGAGNPSALIDGILFSGGSVRVAVRDSIPYTFGRVVGFDQRQIIGRAQVAFNGNLLPIAVRNYVNAPGTSSGAYPCVDDQRAFMDFFATANTACIGTDVNSSLRTAPTAGAAFSTSTPDNDRDHHGPVVEILGQGAQPGNGADFRGFVALDIRNFLNTSSQIYYNDVPIGTTSSTLKDLAARWIYTGGYPGPLFMTPVTPPHAMDQVGLLNGNSTGAAIDALDDRFSPGDAILVAVYSGLTMQIPDFQMNAPASIALPATGTTTNVGSFKVSRNQSFAGSVALTTLGDAGDPQNPMTAATLTSSPPFTYTPTPVTPSMGQGTTVTMTNATTAAATPGIYTSWVRGEAGSPYLTVKYQPFALQVGSVSRDFSITAAATESLAPTLGSSATWSLTLKRVGSGSFGANVALSLEAMPESTLPTGLGAVSFSSASVSPGSGSGTTVSMTINAGTLAAGQYRMVVRATGMNGDSPNRQVTHLLPIVLSVATGTSSSNTEYVDITGFAVMRIASINSNTAYAYAVTPVIADMADSRLRLGQVARLVVWN
jgi:hypothetical protein